MQRDGRSYQWTCCLSKTRPSSQFRKLNKRKWWQGLTLSTQVKVIRGLSGIIFKKTIKDLQPQSAHLLYPHLSNNSFRWQDFLILSSFTYLWVGRERREGKKRTRKGRQRKKLPLMPFRDSVYLPWEWLIAFSAFYDWLRRPKISPGPKFLHLEENDCEASKSHSGCNDNKQRRNSLRIWDERCNTCVSTTEVYKKWTGHDVCLRGQTSSS